MVKAGIGESGSVRRKSSRFENRADEPVLVTIKVDVLVSTYLEFLDIPFFVNRAAYEGTELRVSFINDVLVGLDVGRPILDCLVDSAYVMFFRAGCILRLDGLTRLPGR